MTSGGPDILSPEVSVGIIIIIALWLSIQTIVNKMKDKNE